MNSCPLELTFIRLNPLAILDLDRWPDRTEPGLWMIWYLKTPQQRGFSFSS